MFEGPKLAELLDRIATEVGPQARVAGVTRVRKGGIAGFFAREHFEVRVDMGDAPPAAGLPAGPAAGLPPAGLPAAFATSQGATSQGAASEAGVSGDAVSNGTDQSGGARSRPRSPMERTGAAPSDWTGAALSLLESEDAAVGAGSGAAAVPAPAASAAQPVAVGTGPGSWATGRAAGVATGSAIQDPAPDRPAAAGARNGEGSGLVGTAPGTTAKGSAPETRAFAAYLQAASLYGRRDSVAPPDQRPTPDPAAPAELTVSPSKPAPAEQAVSTGWWSAPEQRSPTQQAPTRESPAPMNPAPMNPAPGNPSPSEPAPVIPSPPETAPAGPEAQDPQTAVERPGDGGLLAGGATGSGAPAGRVPDAGAAAGGPRSAPEAGDESRFATDGPLAALGLPGWLRPAGLGGRRLGEALTESLAMLPQPPRPVRGAGQVMVLAGPLHLCLPAARRVAEEVGVSPAEVVLAAEGDDFTTHGRRIRSVSAARHRAKQWRTSDGPPVLVALATPVGGRGLAWATSILVALQPDAVWGVVSATTKGGDCVEWAKRLGVEAVVVEEADASRSPATVLEMGIPVATVDGRPATAELWAALLVEKLVRGLP
ncbi:MAG: hypothetical protein M0Z87_02835 [Actinomycetota bacterium]|nr:hypothetical protein [Actinomycetota bacterium]